MNHYKTIWPAIAKEDLEKFLGEKIPISTSDGRITEDGK